MSQFFVGVTAGSLPPTVATSYMTDSGTAIPAAGVLRVNGGSGISTSGSSNQILISIQNSVTANVTTVGAQTLPIITIPLAAFADTYTFDVRVAGIDITSILGVGANIFGTAKTNGTTASLIAEPEIFVYDDPPDTGAGVMMTASGNSVVISVTGVAGETIEWGGIAVWVTAV